jgi:RNA polymerase sigma factor (sigma-70 family)
VIQREESADYWRSLLTGLARDLERVRSGTASQSELESDWAQLARRLRVIADSIVRRRTLAGLDPDDLAHDVLARLQETGVLDRVRTASTPLGYLHRMMLNRALDLIRRQRRESELSDQYGAELQSALSGEAAEVSEDAEAHQVAALKQALKHVRPADRLILKRRFWEGRSTAQIAKELGISYTAAAVRLHRLLRRLADDLEDSP